MNSFSLYSQPLIIFKTLCGLYDTNVTFMEELNVKREIRLRHSDDKLYIIKLWIGSTGILKT